MARPSGHWLAYLRFDHHDETRVLHLLCSNKAQLDGVLSLLKGIPVSSGTELIEYAIFHSGRNVYLREAPNFPERHILTYETFMAAWRGEPSRERDATTTASSRPDQTALASLLGPAPLALEAPK